MADWMKSVALQILSSDWVNVDSLSAAYLCGPEAMIWACKAALESAGMPFGQHQI